MARSRSSRSSSSSRRAPAAPSKTSVPSTAASHPPAPVQQQPSLFANMASTAAGVAVGSAVGHTIGHGISGLFGGRSAEPVQQPLQEQPVSVCEPDQSAFMKCLDTNAGDISACQFYLDMLKQCQAGERVYQ